MTSRIAAMKEHADLDAADKKAVEKVLPQVPAKARQAFVDTMKELMK